VTKEPQEEENLQEKDITETRKKNRRHDKPLRGARSIYWGKAHWFFPPVTQRGKGGGPKTFP